MWAVQGPSVSTLPNKGRIITAPPRSSSVGAPTLDERGGAVMVRPLFGKVETLGPWTAHIQAMDQALQSNDPGESVRAWRQAYSSALSHPGWLGLLTVANASLLLS